MIININTQSVVIFDLEDTLYYEIDYLISAYKSIATCIDAKNQKMIFSIMFSMYRNNQDVFEYLSKTYNLPKEDLLKTYRGHMPDIVPNEGVLNLMNSIKNLGGKIGVITDGRTVTQKNKITALGLDKYIDILVISEDMGVEKPDSKAFLYVAKQLKGEEYHYIADNFSKDFIAPKKLKWNTIAIVDRGKNIHTKTYLHNETYKCPESLVYSLKEIKIV